MIPQTIHQIWIGPKPPPQHWTDTWRRAHPGWEYRMWDEPALDELGLAHRHLYDRYRADGRWCGAANIARVEILLKFGGVYIDADTECLQPLGDAPFMQAGMFVPYTPNTANGRVSNAVMGCTPQHPTMAAYQDALSSVTELHPSWKKTGALLLTEVIHQHPHGVQLLPAATFLPVRIDGRRAPAYDGPVYGTHHWGTTKGRY
jgi:mannosyltransferase OCH1-like enzyme